MSAASTRSVAVSFTGDGMNGTRTFPAANNGNAPGDADIFTLAAGFNSIPLPAGGSLVTGATIIPPSGNVNTITLKGITTDTGIPLHKTDPTSIALENPSAFGLTCGGIITGLWVIWT